MLRAKNITYLKSGQVADRAKRGVSLHCHTQHSKEILDFVPYYAERIPIVSYFWRREVRRCVETYGRAPKFNVGHWTPPLCGTQVVEMERESMAAYGLDGIVSITDHDSIAANFEVRSNAAGKAPISLEWTVPFGEGFFHVGVHNLPPDKAVSLTEELLKYTYAAGYPDKERLRELLDELHHHPEVLIVLNHPIWDIEMIGQARHEQNLAVFLDEFAEWIHAIEVNGFRNATENNTAIALAERLGLPTISGGDRHCLHANTVFNVTEAADFAEFVSEIRKDRHSRIVVTERYNVPLPVRQVASIAQILSTFENFPENRRRWTDRIFIEPIDATELRTLTQHWNGQPPLWARAAIIALNMISRPAALALIGFSVGDTDIGREADSQFSSTFLASPKKIRPRLQKQIFRNT